LWESSDIWHRLSNCRLRTEVLEAVGTRPFQSVAINLGSAGNDLGLQFGVHIHLDISAFRLRPGTSVVGNVESLPIASDSVDVALSVGSILNHGDAEQMIREISRVLRLGGVTLIEFDCSDGLHQATRSRGNPIVSTPTFFNRRMLILQEYSREHIERMLEQFGMHVYRRVSFHIISSLFLRFRLNPSLAAPFIVFDRLARQLNWLRYRGSSILLVAEKR
jgi:SAM-dependent methyltransferase